MIGDENGADVIADVTGVVLAGGRSSRMGTDKATLIIGGEPLLRRIVGRLRRALADTLVIGPPELAALLQPSALGQTTKRVNGHESEPITGRITTTRVIPDAQPGLGPLGGLATALGAITTSYAFVIACDMPFVQPALIRIQARLALANDTMTGAPTQRASDTPPAAVSASPAYDVVALRTAQGLEPLHAVYARACLPSVIAQLAAHELAMWRLLARLHVRELTADEVARADPQGLSTLNANTQDEWARMIALADGAAGR